MQGLYDAVAGRLSDGRCPALLQVATGMSQDALDTFALSEAATALVTPLSDQAEPVREAGFIVSQRETWLFGVTLALVYPAGFAQFEPARDQVKAALRGWLPEGAARPVEYAGSQLLTYSVDQKGGLWTHLLRFRTQIQTTYEAQS